MNEDEKGFEMISNTIEYYMRISCIIKGIFNYGRKKRLL